MWDIKEPVVKETRVSEWELGALEPLPLVLLFSYKRANHSAFVHSGIAVVLKKRAEYKARPSDALFYDLSPACLWLAWPCHRLHNACDSIHRNAITLPWPLCFRVNTARGRFSWFPCPGARSNQNDSANKFGNQNRRAAKHSALF